MSERQRPQVTAGDAQEGVRRLDWRFLVANPGLDRVGYIGRRDTCLAALRTVSRSVEILDSGAVKGGDHSPAHEVVVACEPSQTELQRAAGAVTPGGTLVVEARGPFGALTARRRWRLPGRLVQEISRLGFEEVRPYWHWPTFDQCTRIIPLDDQGAIRCALSLTSRNAGSRAVAWAARLLLQLGLLGWITGSVSVVGRRARPERPAGRPRSDAGGRSGTGEPEAPARSPNMVLAFLEEHWDRLGLSRHSVSRRLSFVLLTPRFLNSSHLVFLLMPEGESQPRLVAKLPRLPKHRATEREAQVLRQVQESRSGGFESIPRLVAHEAYRDHMILVETALSGRALDRATVRRTARRSCEAALAWLLEIQSATRHAPDSAGDWFERLIERQSAELEATLPMEERLIARTRELTQPLAKVNLPLVLEHGDLSDPNLLVDHDGRIAVLDWELAETRGLPATDLFFFLAYVARALSGARSGIESVAAVDRAFLGRRSWARAYVRRYAEAMALSLGTLTPLLVACWERQVSGLARRMMETRESSDGMRAGVARWIRQDWRFAVWQHVVAHAHQLRWDDPPP
jgi:hypothetical protein